MYQKSSIEDDIMVWRRKGKEIGQYGGPEAIGFNLRLIACDDEENRETGNSAKPKRRGDRLKVKIGSSETQDHCDDCTELMNGMSFRYFTKVPQNANKPNHRYRHQLQPVTGPTNTQTKVKGRLTKVREKFKRIIEKL